MFPRQSEQCPVVELSYMGYSSPKCTCNDSTQTHSSKYMILLECLHDMDENVTHPFPLLESSLTPSRMSKPNVRKKHRFQNKRFLFLKPSYRVSVNILDYPSRRITGSFFRNSHGSAFEMNYWTTLQGNYSKNLPLKFLSQPFSIFLFFHFLSFSFMSCTHT